jgi:hypothetical protein
MLKKLVVSALFVGSCLTLGMAVPQVAHATLPKFHQVTKCVMQGQQGVQLCTVYSEASDGSLTPLYCYYLYANGSRSPIFVSPDL